MIILFIINFQSNNIPPIHKVVGLNVTQYSNATDVTQITSLGPKNLNLTVDSTDPDYIPCNNNSTSLFGDVTSTLSGNLTLFSKATPDL